ncbi:MAG: hypothetical protein ACREV8_06105 [Gammaproteobacteria bacterium]
MLYLLSSGLIPLSSDLGFWSGERRLLPSRFALSIVPLPIENPHGETVHEALTGDQNA